MDAQFPAARRVHGAYPHLDRDRLVLGEDQRRGQGQFLHRAAPGLVGGVVAAAVLAGIWALMTRTKAGLLMRATQVDRDVARAFGINVDRVYMGTFALGAGLAALAGVLIVPITQAHYLMGGDPLLLSFIVVIIGGLGSL